MKSTVLKLAGAAAIFMASHANAAVVPNGVHANGLAFNGLAFNGLAFNGLAFNGLAFNGLAFNGLAFNGLAFNGLAFNGLAFNGDRLNGLQIDKAGTVAKVANSAPSDMNAKELLETGVSLDEVSIR